MSRPPLESVQGFVTAPALVERVGGSSVDLARFPLLDDDAGRSAGGRQHSLWRDSTMPKRCIALRSQGWGLRWAA